MTKLFKALNFLQLLDREGNLSISNVAVIVCITKMAIAPQASIVDAGALLISLLNYGHKRLESNKISKAEKEVSEVATLKDELAKIQATVTDLQETNEAITKQSEDVKKLLNASSLAGVFQGRGKQ